MITDYRRDLAACASPRMPEGETDRIRARLALFFFIDEPVPFHELERRFVARILDLTGGNVNDAARVMKMNRRTIYRRHGDLIYDAKKRTKGGMTSFERRIAEKLLVGDSPYAADGMRNDGRNVCATLRVMKRKKFVTGPPFSLTRTGREALAKG